MFPDEGWAGQPGSPQRDWMRIFLIEDEPEMMRFLEVFLLIQRHTVFSFLDGETATEALEELCPDVVLCDLSLPGLDGEEVARAAARLPRPPRIVLMSGERERLERARPLAQALLRKPFGITELVEALEGD
jgi:two-component system, OmpR family, response regulator